MRLCVFITNDFIMLIRGWCCLCVCVCLFNCGGGGEAKGGAGFREKAARMRSAPFSRLVIAALNSE